jgi:hypothetical protein
MAENVELRGIDTYKILSGNRAVKSVRVGFGGVQQNTGLPAITKYKSIGTARYESGVIELFELTDLQNNKLLTDTAGIESLIGGGDIDGDFGRAELITRSVGDIGMADPDEFVVLARTTGSTEEQKLVAIGRELMMAGLGMGNALDDRFAMNPPSLKRNPFSRLQTNRISRRRVTRTNEEFINPMFVGSWTEVKNVRSNQTNENVTLYEIKTIFGFSLGIVDRETLDFLFGGVEYAFAA